MDSNNQINTKQLLDTASPGQFEAGQSVQLEISSETDLGFKAIVNGTHWGLLFREEIFQPLSKGQKIQGYIKQVREDGKLDLILYQAGNKDSQEIGQKILAELKKAGGFLAVSDKTPPETIYRMFGVSKKKYKIAVGGLYKQRKILVEERGISLVYK